MYGAFGSFDEPQSAAFGPQRHRKLEWNPETLQWEPTQLDEDEYDYKYRANSARGAFPTFGRVAQTGPDTSTQDERDLLSPQGEPEFYKSSLDALRRLLQSAQQRGR